MAGCDARPGPRAYTKGKGCLYIKRLADIDAEVLAAIIRAATRA